MDKYLERIATALETIAARLSGNTNVPAAAENVATEKPARKPRVKAEVAIAEAEGVDTPAAVEEIPQTKPISLAEVADAVRKLVGSDTKEGHGKATSILGSFGAKRISELKPENFPEVIAKIEALLKAK